MATHSDRFIARRETELDERERTLVSSWGSEAFGLQEWVADFAWATPDWRLFLLENERPVSHLKLTMRHGRIGSREVPFAGVGGVMTPRIHQRKGFSSALLDFARDFIFSELDAEYGLLFCLPELTPFYGRRGWTSVNSPVHIEQAQGKIVWPKAAMVLPASDRSWQEAAIDVCGKPW